jgi:hypothetical protein
MFIKIGKIFRQLYESPFLTIIGRPVMYGLTNIGILRNEPCVTKNCFKSCCTYCSAYIDMFDCLDCNLQPHNIGRTTHHLQPDINIQALKGRKSKQSNPIFNIIQSIDPTN